MEIRINTENDKKLPKTISYIGTYRDRKQTYTLDNDKRLRPIEASRDT